MVNKLFKMVNFLLVLFFSLSFDNIRQTRINFIYNLDEALPGYVRRSFTFWYEVINFWLC